MTSKGNRARGVPLGVKREKNFNPLLDKPSIKLPVTTVKLIDRTTAR